MLRNILICCAIVLAFDSATSGISRATGVPYADFTLPEIAMYAVLGLVLERSAGFGAPTMLPVTIAAIVEVTAGWWISVEMGVGRRPTHHLEVTLFSAFVPALLCTAVGALGMWIGYGLRRASSKSDVA